MPCHANPPTTFLVIVRLCRFESGQHGLVHVPWVNPALANCRRHSKHALLVLGGRIGLLLRTAGRKLASPLVCCHGNRGCWLALHPFATRCDSSTLALTSGHVSIRGNGPCPAAPAAGFQDGLPRVRGSLAKSPAGVPPQRSGGCGCMAGQEQQARRCTNNSAHGLRQTGWEVGTCLAGCSA